MRKLALALVAATIVTPAVLPTAAVAQDRRDDRYDRRDDRTYRDSDRGNYPCKRSKGTTGTVAGAVGGGVLGNVLGGGTLGTLAGAGGGALLGRHLDKKHDEAQNRKNGC